MLKASYIAHTLNFKIPGGTSRGVLHEKKSWFIKLWDDKQPEVCGWGEVGYLKGLSYDPEDLLETRIREFCEEPEWEEYRNLAFLDFPALRFAVEQAFLDLENGGQHILFPSDFTAGKKDIPMNGLIWMGKSDFMEEQIREKLEQGFRCIKLKIGAIDWKEELRILKELRKKFPANELEIRVDANGGFSYQGIFRVLEQLAALEIHSIEQPIATRQWEHMADVIDRSPVHVALDEELIGVHSKEEKRRLLDILRPDFLILKPSLLGGFSACEEWIELANKQSIHWWATSALESNIGLNAIAQWTFMQNNPLPQGLGTGQLYTNNFPSPLEVKNASLHHDPKKKWDLSLIQK